MFDNIKETLTTWWDNTKAFFKYSETILWARIQTLTGLITGAIGAIDWTNLFNENFANIVANKTVLYVALGFLLNGLITETLRRRNADL